MGMKSAVGPELLGSLHLQGTVLGRGLNRGLSPDLSPDLNQDLNRDLNRGLARGSMGPRTMGASIAPGTATSGSAAPPGSFRSFLPGAGSLMGRPEAEPIGSGAGDSALKEFSRLPERVSESAEPSATRKTSERSGESKANESKRRAVPSAQPPALTTITASAVIGQAPVPLTSPSASQPVRPPTLSVSLAVASPLVSEANGAHAPMESASPFAVMGQSERFDRADIPPAGSTSDAGAESSKKASDGNERSAGAGAIDKPLASAVAGIDGAGAAVRLAVPPISGDGALAPLDGGASLASPANQTRLLDAKSSKTVREISSERSKSQTTDPGTSHEAPTALIAHGNTAGPVAASHPPGNGSAARELSSGASASPVAANSGLSPEAIGIRDRSSAKEPAAAEPFAALDHGASEPAPIWTRAGTNKVEAGFQDPSLGWVGVRATADASGMHAAVVPSSPEASRMLSGSLSDLGAYLVQQHHPLQSLTIAPAQAGGLGNAGSPYDGAVADQGHSQERGNSQQTDAGAKAEMDHNSAIHGAAELLDAGASSSLYVAPAGALISVFA
jgi:hypothetical protein